MTRTKTDNPEDIGALAREYGQAAIQVLVDIMNDEEVAPSTRLSAAKTILERGYGKPGAQKKEEHRTAPVGRVEWHVVDHRPPEDRPEPVDGSQYPASCQSRQSARPPSPTRLDRQPGEDRLAQPP